MTGAVRVGIGAVLLACAMAALAIVVWYPRQSPSASQPLLTLLVNDRGSVDVAPGTPLVFTLTLTGDRRGKAAIGSNRHPWHTMLGLRDHEGRALAWPVVTHGEPRASAVTFSGGIPTISTTVSAVAELEWQRSEHTVWLAVPPEATTSLSGTTRVHAVLDSPWWTWPARKGDVRSLDVTIRVPADAGTRGDLKLEKLRQATQFFLARREFESALAASNDLAQLEPDNVSTLVLRGDALAGMNRSAEALAAYRRAIALRRISYEEPVLLLDRITRMLESTSR